MMDNTVRRYTVVIYSENQIGVLTQVANVFTRRSLNIWSLSAGASAIEGVHIITIVTDAVEKRVLESVKQLEKRVDVMKVFYYTEDQVVYRELALYKVPTGKILESAQYACYSGLYELLNKVTAKAIEDFHETGEIPERSTMNFISKMIDKLPKLKNFEAMEITDKLEAAFEEDNSSKDINTDILLSVDKFLRGSEG